MEFARWLWEFASARIDMDGKDYYETFAELDDEDWAIAKRIGETFREEVEAYAAAVEAGEIEE